MDDKKSDISIIVRTKDRPDHLVACLRSILVTYLDFPYKEIIVVDSSDNSISKINQKEVQKINGKYIYEHRKGHSFARNTGIKESSGKIVIFVDDDFLVDKDWIKNLIKNYDDSDIGCCTGNMLTYRKDNVSNIFEESITFSKGDKKRIFTRRDTSIIKLLDCVFSIGEKRLDDKTPIPWVIGAGFCSFRRHIFDDIGYFDVSLNKGGEDLDMFYRILKVGYKIAYDPKAIIYHNHRQSFDMVLLVAYSNGRGSRNLIEKYYKRDFYMSICFFGYFFLLLFSLIKSSRKIHLQNMISAEMKGFLKWQED